MRIIENYIAAWSIYAVETCFDSLLGDVCWLFDACAYVAVLYRSTRVFVDQESDDHTTFVPVRLQEERLETLRCPYPLMTREFKRDLEYYRGRDVMQDSPAISRKFDLAVIQSKTSIFQFKFRSIGEKLRPIGTRAM